MVLEGSFLLRKEFNMKYYDRISNKYIDVTTTTEIETEIKRSYWREAQQERRYNKRCQEFLNELHYDMVLQCPIDEQIIRRQEIEVLVEVLGNLPEREQTIVRLLYYENKTKSEAAEYLGCSNSYMTKLVYKLMDTLRDKYLELYEY